MLNSFFKKHPETFFVAKFLLLFSIFYFGTELWIGITSPENYYNAFCDKNLNYIKWLRLSILSAATFLCGLFKYQAELVNSNIIIGFNGFQINMIYSCIGYGLLSFWAAFTIAFPTTIKQKLIWLVAGLLVLWFTNVVRIALLLIIINKAKSVAPFQNHHTIYNAITYCIIAGMIYFFIKEKKV